MPRPHTAARGWRPCWGASFLDELFSIYPLRKVYALVYDYNGASLRSNLQAGFVEEGVMRDYRYLGGSYHDCHILAMTREAFGERLARFSQFGAELLR